MVECIRLDDWIGRSEIPPSNFIHVDVQGAELLVLEGPGIFLNKLSLIWQEIDDVELYANQLVKEDIRVDFKERGRQMKANTTGRYEKVWGDQLWLNESASIGQITSSRWLMIRLFSFDIQGVRKDHYSMTGYSL